MAKNIYKKLELIIWFALIAGVVAVDQISKHLVMNFLDRENSLVIIDGVFRFTYVENTGAAMGSFSGNRWVFMTVSIIGIIVMLVYLCAFRPQNKLACAALSMVIGGGIGNMVDRCFYKGTLPSTEGEYVVIDFLDFCFFENPVFVKIFGYNVWPWVFNVADSFVCVGAAILILWCIYALIIEMKTGKKTKMSEATTIEIIKASKDEGAQAETSAQTEQQPLDGADLNEENKDK